MYYNLTFEDEEVTIVNLSNMKYKYVEVEDTSSLKNEIKNFVGNNDYDLQYLNGQLEGPATNHILEIYELAERTNEPIWEVSTLFNYYYNLDEIEYYLQQKNYYSYIGDNELDVFKQYVEDIGILNNIPNNFLIYIDYEKLKRDMVLGGDITIIDSNMYDYEYNKIFLIVSRI